MYGNYVVTTRSFRFFAHDRVDDTSMAWTQSISYLGVASSHCADKSLVSISKVQSAASKKQTDPTSHRNRNAVGHN